ncbi:hypothetical protein PACTADRAFT_75084 [Pachysolen tannophilus NRRL Y-2460]|uniref:EKC/KEOPS complex subunit CGI121 n=1 Tax=Pachysolen tannophilus NRRL Y-2460 TaxID=669874 RepID=A0A1E4TVT5_PACTA|nr:hypothetical protein PACTADRAFT_75084 [Pachysolen tannophilus NRRL Y-2460]
MTLEKVIVLPQFPNITVLITLFNEVKNLKEIKNKLIEKDRNYDYSFINPSMILSIEQLYSSIYKTLLSVENKTLKSNSVNSELILNLSNMNKIVDSLNRFGINEKNDNLIVVKFILQDDDKLSVKDHLMNLEKIIKGELVEFNDINLMKLVDLSQIKKTFKLNGESDNIERLSKLIIGITQLK